MLISLGDLTGTLLLISILPRSFLWSSSASWPSARFCLPSGFFWSLPFPTVSIYESAPSLEFLRVALFIKCAARRHIAAPTRNGQVFAAHRPAVSSDID